MDPLSSVNKVFFPKFVRGHNHSIGEKWNKSLMMEGVAFAIKNERFHKNGTSYPRNHRWKFSFDTHCKIHDHTKEKYYKLHEYHLGFEQR